MQIGRNQPCWCGSGRKYKKCHLDRERQIPPSISDGFSAINSARSASGTECNCPDEIKSECHGNPINSHTIAKSLGLMKIARNGHVLGIKHDFKTLKSTKGILQLGKISVNKISVFPGFCSVHDSSIFKPLESYDFIPTQQQCVLLSYRALARERHAKEAAIGINHFLKTADRGRPLSYQVPLQRILSNYELGLSLAKNDLDNALKEHKKSIISGEYSQFESLAIKFTHFPILCSTGHFPSDDWSGKIIQDLTNPSLKADWLTAASLISKDAAWVTFTWLKSSEKIRNFVESLLDNQGKQISDALVKYFFSISENIAVDESWWADLNTKQKEELNLRIRDGLPIIGGVNKIAPRPGEQRTLDTPEIDIIRL